MIKFDRPNPVRLMP